jgi:hypothetical protein
MYKPCGVGSFYWTSKKDILLEFGQLRKSKEHTQQHIQDQLS